MLRIGLSGLRDHHCERMTITKRVLMSGNDAIACGAIAAGCRFYAGYPITPQNELIAYMSEHLEKMGGSFVQAESELAAINMVFGAAACGVRAMTSSSSPGISLKQEGISYMAGAQLPGVIVNIMRGGPGLGNIAPAQSDYFQATRGGGHGDYRCIVLAPSTVQEAYDIMGVAFELSDQYRTPSIILGDGVLGQMMEPVLVGSRESEVVRKKQIVKPWALTGCAGRKPNVVRSFRMHEGELEKLNIELQKNYARIVSKEQRAETLFIDDARVILIAYGTMGRIAKGIVRQLRSQGIKVGLIRPITLWPFPKKIIEKCSLRRNVSFVVTEMSYGQMVEDVRLCVNGRHPVTFLGRAAGGIPEEAVLIKKMKELAR